MAKLYFKYSGMNAGKSTALLQTAYNYGERGMDVLLYNAEVDDRMGEAVIGSRIGIHSPAQTFNNKTDMFADITRQHALSPVACVLVDECHLLSRDHVWQLSEVVDKLSIPVMCYGLRTDFKGTLFPGSEQLLALADNLEEIKTICDCGSKAIMTVRVDTEGNALQEGPQTEIGGNDRYVSYCRRHWKEKIGI